MIQVKNISYSYEQGNAAVNGISLNIEKGECVGIVGSNGAGKSTLLKMLCAILLPSGGEIEIGGVKLEKNKLSEIRKIVGFVFQNPDDQLFMSSVYEDIAFGLRNMGMHDHEIEEKINEILKNLNIEHLSKRAPFRLSGGEKRTVAIACVLAMNPSVVLFDEPTAFLDIKSRRMLINTVKSLKTTNVIVTHDFNLVLEVCSRVIVMFEGKIIADGEPKQILFNEKLMQQADLETPLKA